VFLNLWGHSVQDEGVKVLGLHDIVHDIVHEETAVTIYEYARRDILKYFTQIILFFVMVLMSMFMKTVVYLQHYTIKLHFCDVNIFSPVDF